MDYICPYIPAPIRANIDARLSSDKFLFSSREHVGVFADNPSKETAILKTADYQTFVIRANIIKDILQMSSTLKKEHITRDMAECPTNDTEAFVDVDCHLVLLNEITHSREK